MEKKWHMRRNYKARKKGQSDEKNQKKADDQNTIVVVSNEDEELVVISFDKDKSQVIDSCNEWVINSTTLMQPKETIEMVLEK